jgi:hypothetical protein
LDHVVLSGYEQLFEAPASLGNFSSTGVTTHDQFESIKDGNPVVRTYDNFTINTGHTVTTTNRCKGLYLNILGDLVVNGTLSMTARGAKAEGRYVIIDPSSRWIYYFTNMPTDNTFITHQSKFSVISKVGGLGAVNKSSIRALAQGGNGVNGACAAGGGNYQYRGGHGTSFSGGAGAGGGASDSDASGMISSSAFSGGTAGADNGGAGGTGSHVRYSNGGSGAGNPAGAVQGTNAKVGKDGTGGLLILFVQGNIILGSAGSIQSAGSAGGDGHKTLANTYPYSQGGGGSGAGAIHIFHRGSINDSSKITAIGGVGGSIAGNTTTVGSVGPNGGNGTINLVSL